MTERQLWDYFVGKGLTEAGTAGLMGNLAAESGLRFNNLENSYEKKFGMSDDAYTIACDGGEWDFVHDSAGYGLAQWTYWSRKEGLFKLAQSRKVSIADPQTQLDWLLTELTGGYRAVWDVLTRTDSVTEASNTVMTQFERPADQSATALTNRARLGMEFYERLKSSASTDKKTVPKKRIVSPLATEMVSFGGINSNPRLNEVSKITIHHMAGINTGAGCARWHLKNAGRQSSANYYIGNNGDICAAVSEDRRAWTSGTGNAKGSNDHCAVTIEVSNSKTDNPWPISDKAYASLIKLCADICTFYGIKPHYDGTANGTLTLHKMFQATACPGPYLEALHKSGQVERDIIAAMSGRPQETSQETPGNQKDSKVLWRVQTGAFSGKDFAFSMLKGLRLKGMDGIVVKADDGFYKAQVGAFADKSNAEKKARELEKMGFDTFITEKGGEVIAENSMVVYTVKPGDTLTGIARAYQTSVARLVAANSIENADRIDVGQRLVIV